MIILKYTGYPGLTSAQPWLFIWPGMSQEGLLRCLKKVLCVGWPCLETPGQWGGPWLHQNQWVGPRLWFQSGQGPPESLQTFRNTRYKWPLRDRFLWEQIYSRCLGGTWEWFTIHWGPRPPRFLPKSWVSLQTWSSASTLLIPANKRAGLVYISLTSL